METRFVVVDEYRSRDVHGVHQTKTFHHAAPVDEFLDLRRDVDEPAPVRNFKPEIFGEAISIGNHAWRRQMLGRPQQMVHAVFDRVKRQAEKRTEQRAREAVTDPRHFDHAVHDV
jgi:hypothetical protein